MNKQGKQLDPSFCPLFPLLVKRFLFFLPSHPVVGIGMCPWFLVHNLTTQAWHESCIFLVFTLCILACFHPENLTWFELQKQLSRCVKDHRKHTCLGSSRLSIHESGWKGKFGTQNPPSMNCEDQDSILSCAWVNACVQIVSCASFVTHGSNSMDLICDHFELKTRTSSLGSYMNIRMIPVGNKKIIIQ